MKLFRKFPYWYLIAVPVLLMVLGAASNQLVLIANHGKFPVMMNDVAVAAHCSDPEEVPVKYKNTACTTDGKGGEYIDKTHTIMGNNSRLKALADIFDLGNGIYSIGDFLLMLGQWMFSFSPIAWLVLTMKRIADIN